MNKTVCDVCEGYLYRNPKSTTGTYLERVFALTGFYKIFIPKIKIVDLVYGKRNMDVCPKCFQDIVGIVLANRLIKTNQTER